MTFTITRFLVALLTGMALLAGAEAAPFNVKKPAGAAIAIPTPTLTRLRVLNPTNYQEITGNDLPGPKVRIEFRGENDRLLTGNDVTWYRLSERSNFAGAQWKRMDALSNARPEFTVSSGTGNKTIYGQVRTDIRTASGRTLQRVSAKRGVTKHWTDPVQQALATLQRLGCLHDLSYQNGLVVAVRCPLAETGKRLQGLGNLKLNLEQLAPLMRSKFELKGTIEGSVVDESETLDPIKVAGIVRVAAKAIRTNSTSVSVSQNTLKIRFHFESSGTEFKLALAQPVGGTCDACLPDLHWNNAGLTVNLTFGGSPSNLAITKVEITNLSGSWDLAGNLGAAAEAALKAVGINGATALRNKVSQVLSGVIQSKINAIVSDQKDRFEQALIGPLRAGFSAPGNLTVGYRTFNSSIVAEFRP